MELSNEHHFGNFRNYYSFHPTGERTSRFPQGLFRAIWEAAGKQAHFYMLDIGCNEGNLSLELLNIAQKDIPDAQCYMLGVDIDDVLIQRAKSKSIENLFSSFLTVDIMKDDENQINEYLKQRDMEQFSFVSCFSITMWIHMNHNDDGLKFFLNEAVRYTSGSLLLEPQPWRCYRNAIQRCRRLNISELPHYQDLIIRNIEDYSKVYITSIGLMTFNVLDEKEWGRKLIIFHRNSSSLIENILCKDAI
eukprot:gene972-1890_t